jgi:hypothetical protein
VKHEDGFYLVWNKDGSAPRVKHDNFVSARVEAERLARRNPGERFIVLQSVCARVVNDMQEIECRPADDLPF